MNAKVVEIEFWKNGQKKILHRLFSSLVLFIASQDLFFMKKYVSCNKVCMFWHLINF